MRRKLSRLAPLLVLVLALAPNAGADPVTVLDHCGEQNRAPSADANGPYGIFVGGTLRLDGARSSDPDSLCGDTINVAWDVNGDLIADFNGESRQVTWAELHALDPALLFPSSRVTGQPSNPVHLTVTDSHGLQATDTSSLRIFPNADLVVGRGAGPPIVKTFRQTYDAVIEDRQFRLDAQFRAFVANIRDGVRVATGYLNADFVPDIVTAPGGGPAPRVRIFDGDDHAFIRQFAPYGQNLTGGVYVAADFFNNDDIADILTGAGSGPPVVRKFDGATRTRMVSFLAYPRGFTGGVRVAAGDVNGDSVPDIIAAPGPGSPQKVKVFSGANRALIASFFAYGPNFRGGVFVASGDLDGDNKADIVTGRGAGAPTVRIFDGATRAREASFAVYPAGFGGGVRVAAGDLNGDGGADIIIGPGPGSPQKVKVFDGDDRSLDASFFAFGNTFRGGVFVAGGD